LVIKKVLIVRNDKIGDLILIIPAVYALYKTIPQLKVSLLVSGYAKDITNFIPNINKVIIDDGDIDKLTDAIKKCNFDAVISLFSSFRVARVLKLARIPIRIAPATKMWQFYYNHRVPQRRSLSLKPEFIYNRELISYFCSVFFKKDLLQTYPPYIKIAKKDKQKTMSVFYKKYPDLKNQKVILIHPGSGGSAQNLKLEQYAILIKELSKNNYRPLISAGVSLIENENANILQNMTKKYKTQTYQNKNANLYDFVCFLSVVDVFIAGSTGPLHIAAALNKKTIGFYPNRLSATSLRWQTINENKNRLSFSPPQNCDDMTKIDIKQIKENILCFLNSPT
jgi:ADP-heptose:LPS heptosyltransferase